jgi:two-component system response regulator HydG
MGNRNWHFSAQGCDFLTADPYLLSILRMADKVALTDVPILLEGESGTGKEILARRIHRASKHSSQALVGFSCGTLPENLLISELFGQEKDLPDASKQKTGLLELANGGTLFLDEIGEMGLEAQAKLLRFLQVGEISRVGGSSPVSLQARVISATTRDLTQQIRMGKFREDLYYRLNTVSLSLPPLRKRAGDIAPLAQAFLTSGAPSPVKRFSSEALELLKLYSWPGNVRELKNTVERLKILCESEEVPYQEVSFHLRSKETQNDWKGTKETFDLSTVEKSHILKVLAHFGGNKTKAAGAMGITVKTLYNKLARYQEEENPRLI